MSFSSIDQVFANAQQRRFCRVLADMQCGQPVMVQGDESLLVLAAEQAAEKHMAGFLALGKASPYVLAPSGLLLHLGFEASLPAGAVLCGNPEQLMRHVQQWLSVEAPRFTPELTAKPVTPVGAATLWLAQQATVIPLLFALPLSRKDVEQLQAMNIASIEAEDLPLTPSIEDLLITPRVQLPLAASEKATAFAFRLRYQPQWNLAVFFGDEKDPHPLVRVHSSCLTGDILGSLRCDCGNQLHSALEALSSSKSGILLYLSQEGRGIGLGNKLKAYHLQEKGLDTHDANEALGFEVDARDFTLAALLLKSLGKNGIRLLTNNPRKINELQHLGIVVSERMPLVVKAGEHNHRYLETKAQRMGHLLQS